MSLTLVHLANHRSTNIGNAALILGLERVLREDFPVALDFVPEPWDYFSRGLERFDGTFVRRVNESDGLLVGAAVAMDGRAIYRHTGMRFDLPLPLWDEIERPLVFYGLSYRAWPGKPYHHADALRRMVERATSGEGVLFSVRNDGTKEWLEATTGFASERIRVVPDPALYVPTEDRWHPELREGKANVILALNREDEPYRWGGREPGRWGLRAERLGELLEPTRLGRLAYVPEWKRRRRAFMSGLAAALRRLAREVDLNLVVCAHTFADVVMTAELFELLDDHTRERAVWANHALPTELGPFFYDLYAKADLAISMRIHSMNPAVGLATPVVPLVSQERMTAFMDDAGLGDLCIDCLAPDLEEQVVSAAVRALERPDEIRARLREAAAALRERTRAFNGEVAALLGAAR